MNSTAKKATIFLHLALIFLWIYANAVSQKQFATTILIDSFMLIQIFENIHLALGWTGTFFYLLAYLLLSINKLKPDQRIYHWLNVIGAAGLTANAFYYADMPNVVVNVLWGVIAVGAIIAITKKK